MQMMKSKKKNQTGNEYNDPFRFGFFYSSP